MDADVREYGGSVNVSDAIFSLFLGIKISRKEEIDS